MINGQGHEWLSEVINLQSRVLAVHQCLQLVQDYHKDMEAPLNKAAHLVVSKPV